jgi:SET domain-containing protein
METLYRAIRDNIYDKITLSQVKEHGFEFDSDVFVYNENQTQLTSTVLNRYLFMQSNTFRNEHGGISDDGLKKFNDWLRLWGKIPSFLEIRESKGKGFGVFTTQKILPGVFLGYYDGVRIPLNSDLIKNNYLFKCEHTIIDGQNLTYSNFAVLINDGERKNVEFMEHNGQRMAITINEIEPGEELLTSYGESYWLNRKHEKLI